MVAALTPVGLVRGPRSRVWALLHGGGKAMQVIKGNLRRILHLALVFAVAYMLGEVFGYAFGYAPGLFPLFAAAGVTLVVGGAGGGAAMIDSLRARTNV